MDPEVVDKLELPLETFPTHGAEAFLTAVLVCSLWFIGEAVQGTFLSIGGERRGSWVCVGNREFICWVAFSDIAAL